MVMDDIADLLSSGGIATTIYRGFMPEQPAEAIQVLVTGGMAPIRRMSGTAGASAVSASAASGHTVVEQPTVQIVRRSASLERAMVEMNVIWRMLDGNGDRSINGTRYQWIGAMQQPFPAGRDQSNRSLVSCNFLIAKAVSTATST